MTGIQKNGENNTMAIDKVIITNPENMDDTLLREMAWMNKPKKGEIIDMDSQAAQQLKQARVARQATNEDEQKQKEEAIKKSITTADNNLLDWTKYKTLFDSGNTTKQEVYDTISQDLTETFNFKTMQDTNQIWYFHNQIYKRQGDKFIQKILTPHITKYVTTHGMQEIINGVKNRTYAKREDLSKTPHIIPLKNGWYNLKKKEIQEPNPNKFVTTQMPITYDKKATCPKIKEFIHDIVEEEDVTLLQEIIGYCIYKDYPISKAFMMLGGGENGKSTFLNLLETFLGEKNIATPSLQELLYNRFAKIELYGKLANIHADLSDQKINQTGTFKMLTGRDTIRGEEKYKGSIEFKNYAKLIYSANNLPPTTDDTHAFWRRWLIIKFPYKFTNNPESPNEKQKKGDILKDILDEKELSGLFNWAVEGLQRVLDNGNFTKTTSVESIKDEWLTRSNPLMVFCEKHVEFDNESFVSKDEFYDAYQEFCDVNAAPSLDKNVVGRKLSQFIRGVRSSKRKLSDGSRKNCWDNIKLVTTDQYDVRDVNANPISFLRNESYIKTVVQNTLTSLTPLPKNTENTGKTTLLSYSNIWDKVENHLKAKGTSDINQLLELFDEEYHDDIERFIEQKKVKGELYEPKPGKIGLV